MNIRKPSNNMFQGSLARSVYSKVPANRESPDEDLAHCNPKSCMTRGEVKGGRESFGVRVQSIPVWVTLGLRHSPP